MEEALLQALYGTIIDEYGSIDAWMLGAHERGITPENLSKVFERLKEYEAGL